MIWDTIQDRWKKVAGNTREHWARLARGKHASTEREQTDDGLRNERQKTDLVLEKWQQGMEERADDVVELARDTADAVLVTARANADAVLGAARDRADEGLDSPMLPSAPRDNVENERLLEDEALRVERSAADEGLRRERVEDARSLARLMPLERESTDRYLLTERARSDDAVSNRDDFLGLVTHDLRDLLAGIAMSTALLSRRAGDGEEGAQILVETQRIERYVARMLRLVGDLTDVTSIDSGKFSLTPLRGNATSLLTEAAETFHASAYAKGVSLETTAPAGPLPADFDRDRMLQVLANLIANSLKFTPKGGRITLHGERVDNNLRFCVSDTGPGIPEGSLTSIFERFWQATDNDRRGLGLGLYISRCIVEAHGGRIWAESTPGTGARICFTLPA